MAKKVGKIYVHIEGGCLRAVSVDSTVNKALSKINLSVVLLDEDDMKEEGLSRREREAKIEEAQSGATFIY